MPAFPLPRAKSFFGSALRSAAVNLAMEVVGLVYLWINRFCFARIDVSLSFAPRWLPMPYFGMSFAFGLPVVTRFGLAGDFALSCVAGAPRCTLGVLPIDLSESAFRFAMD